ncbi:MAG TPA: glycosyltransferase family 1 protein [Lentisphaeria bacterium]|nr:glycosyltransferase family 1 protein [Lentisphaeria bacterium]
MKLLVCCVPYDSGHSGVSVYIDHVVRALAAQGHDLTLITEHSSRKHFADYAQVSLPALCDNAVLSMLYCLFVLPWRIVRGRYDRLLMLAATRRMVAWSPCPVVAVAHDLAIYHVQGKYDPVRTFYIKVCLPFFVRRAWRVVAISRATREDLIRHWRVPVDKIRVNHNGLSLPQKHRDGWSAALGLAPGRYILYVSRIEHPGKNHINLIKAYEQLAPELIERYQLVIVGADWSGAEAVHDYARQSPVALGILFAGYIAVEDMADAYRHAACYVFPSRFEGFGLSLIEAMHYGLPCAAANASSLKEIGEGAALLFDPEEPAAIAEAITALLTDDAVRERCRQDGFARAAQFTWEKHARHLVGDGGEVVAEKVADA